MPKAQSIAQNNADFRAIGPLKCCGIRPIDFGNFLNEKLLRNPVNLAARYFSTPLFRLKSSSQNAPQQPLERLTYNPPQHPDVVKYVNQKRQSRSTQNAAHGRRPAFRNSVWSVTNPARA